MRISTLAIVGVGLIGGSIGLAARRGGVAGRVIGIARRPEALACALQRGAIDEGSGEMRAAGHADLVVFCTPVDQIGDHVLAVAPNCRPGTVLTDAGSTKADIARALEGRLPAGVSFLGGHPLAGSEKKGPEHADPELFQGRLVVLTPTASTPDSTLTLVTGFWQALGARVRTMRPEDHDRALAVTSHLPHVVASALAGLLSPDLFELTASGFRDTTRIAAGDIALWTAILKANREGVLAALERFEERLKGFRDALEQREGVLLERLLAEGRNGRNALGD